MTAMIRSFRILRLWYLFCTVFLVFDSVARNSFFVHGAGSSLNFDCSDEIYNGELRKMYLAA